MEVPEDMQKAWKACFQVAIEQECDFSISTSNTITKNGKQWLVELRIIPQKGRE